MIIWQCLDHNRKTSIGVKMVVSSLAIKTDQGDTLQSTVTGAVSVTNSGEVCTIPKKMLSNTDVIQTKQAVEINNQQGAS